MTDLGELDRLTVTAQLCKPTPVRDRWGRYKRDPGGQWDWFYELDPKEREYIAKRHMGGTLGPDELATWLDCSIDEAMAQWLEAVRSARQRVLAGDPFSDDYEDASGYDDSMDLVGPAEMAQMLNVKRGTIDQWRFRGLLPEPTLELSGMPIWTRQCVLDWAQLTGREVVQ